MEKQWSETIQSISYGVESYEIFYCDDGWDGWDIILLNGKKVRFCIASNQDCSDQISIIFTNGEKGAETTLSEWKKEQDGLYGTYELVLRFPDGNTFTLQNVHNGYYAHRARLEIDQVSQYNHWGLCI